MPDAKTKIVAKGKSLYVPIYVFRSGKAGLTISCADSKRGFKVGTTPPQLQKLRNKLEALFVELVEGRSSIATLKHHYRKLRVVHEMCVANFGNYILSSLIS